jgi:hypothetical protein
METKDKTDMILNAERMARETGYKHAIFIIPAYRSLPEEYRISVSNDAGYFGMGAKRIYVTEFGHHPY